MDDPRPDLPRLRMLAPDRGLCLFQSSGSGWCPDQTR
jgi:hypothetical protein